MKYLAAYLLLVQGGNAAPSAADIKAVVESVGAEVDEACHALAIAVIKVSYQLFQIHLKNWRRISSKLNKYTLFGI